MFEKILIPLDGSELAEAILPQVERILRVRDASVALLRVVPVVPGLTLERDPFLPQIKANARDYLAAVAQRLEKKAIDAKLFVETGPPAEVIPAFAAENGASVIAMSTHGRTGVSRWVRGSVAEGVLRRASVPLLLLHSFERPGTEKSPRLAAAETQFARVLFPVADLDDCAAALPLVRDVATLYESNVTVFHSRYLHPALASVYPGESMPMPLPDPPPIDGTTARKVAEELRRQGVRADSKTVTGEPAWEITEELRQHSYDLIVMTTHGRSGLERLILGSVAEKLLRTLTVPILLVRSRELPESHLGG